MKKVLLVIFVFCLGLQLLAQHRSGTIRVRKAKEVKGLYVLEEGDYYKVKLYVRLFDNNAAVFLRAPVSPQRASDSTARLLYTYRKSPAVYRVASDSLYIEGTENQSPFLYKGIIKDNRLRLRKYYRSAQKAVIFKKLL